MQHTDPSNHIDSEKHVREDVYDEDGSVSEALVTRIEQALETRNADLLRDEVRDLHSSEMGHLLEALDANERQSLVGLLGDEFDFEALTEVDETIRLEIVDAMPNSQIAEGVQDLDSDDAVYILEDMDQQDQDEILAKLPFTERVRFVGQFDGGL